MKYILAAAAYDDLDGIEDWVLSNFGVRAAIKAQRDLIEIFRLLVIFPEMGIARPELTVRPVRFFATSHHWIIYEPGSPTIIHRIFPAARDIEQLNF